MKVLRWKKLFFVLVLLCAPLQFVRAVMYPTNSFVYVMEDWESFSDGNVYPTGWNHTGSGTAGIIRKATNFGNDSNTAVLLHGEGANVDGYYLKTQFAGKTTGKVTLDWGRTHFGFTHVISVGDSNTVTNNFTLFADESTGTYRYYGPPGSTYHNTEVNLPTIGTWHHIEYEWEDSNDTNPSGGYDYLYINGQKVPPPTGYNTHRANNVRLVMRNIRFGVAAQDANSYWDNIGITSIERPYAYFDYDVWRNTIHISPSTIVDDNYTNTGNSRSLYEIKKHDSEDRDAYIFTGYSWGEPNGYLFDTLRAIGSNDFGSADPNFKNIKFIVLMDEPELTGTGATKAQLENYIAMARSILPNYKFAISFGALDDPCQDTKHQNGFPRNLDIAILNYYPFSQAGYPTTRVPVVTNKTEFDTRTRKLIEKYKPLTDSNTVWMWDAQVFQNKKDLILGNAAPDANAIKWYNEWVNQEPILIGTMMYKYYGLQPTPDPNTWELGTKDLDPNDGQYIVRQRQAGQDWETISNYSGPSAAYPWFPSNFNRQIYNTPPSHDGWDSHSASTYYFGALPDQRYDGYMGLRIRNGYQSGNWICKPIPDGNDVYGALRMRVKVTKNNTSAADMQMLGLFPGYTGDALDVNGINGDISGSQTFVLGFTKNTDPNYRTLTSSGIWASTAYNLNHSGYWDKVTISWDVSGNPDIYQLWIDGEAVGQYNSLYDANATSIKGIRIFAPSDTGLTHDANLYDSLLDSAQGHEFWVDSVSLSQNLFGDGFESGNFTTGGWNVDPNHTADATVITDAKRTGSYGAKIRKTTWIEKQQSTVGFDTIYVKYDRKTVGLDAGEYLYVEWSINGTNWYQIETTADTAWATKYILCVGAASPNNSSGFRIRFRTNASSTTEYAYVDGVVIKVLPQ